MYIHVDDLIVCWLKCYLGHPDDLLQLGHPDDLLQSSVATRYAILAEFHVWGYIQV